MECADQVLARREVDADLPADGAIHLRQQRRRHLHDAEAAEKGRGGETGHVADHSAAEGDDRRGAVEAAADERVVQARDGRERLRADLKLLDAAGKEVWTGTSNDERFDANDHAGTPLKIGEKYRIEARNGDKEQAAEFEVTPEMKNVIELVVPKS